MNSEYTGMGACGLDCGTCDIRRVPYDREAVERVAGWFRSMGWLEETEDAEEIIEREMYCRGCRGDRDLHWAPQCPLLLCCVDEKKHSHCGECSQFGCEKLETFSQESADHQKAVERLRRLRET